MSAWPPRHAACSRRMLTAWAAGMFTTGRDRQSCISVLAGPASQSSRRDGTDGAGQADPRPRATACPRPHPIKHRFGMLPGGCYNAAQLMKCIIGIDPGLQCTGYGVVRTDGRDCTLLDGGVVRTDPEPRLHSACRLSMRASPACCGSTRPRCRRATLRQATTRTPHADGACAGVITSRGCLQCRVWSPTRPRWHAGPATGGPQSHRSGGWSDRWARSSRSEDVTDALALAICYQPPVFASGTGVIHPAIAAAMKRGNRRH